MIGVIHIPITRISLFSQPPSIFSMWLRVKFKHTNVVNHIKSPSQSIPPERLRACRLETSWEEKVAPASPPVERTMSLAARLSDRSRAWTFDRSIKKLIKTWIKSDNVMINRYCKVINRSRDKVMMNIYIYTIDKYNKKVDN